MKTLFSFVILLSLIALHAHGQDCAVLGVTVATPLLGTLDARNPTMLMPQFPGGSQALLEEMGKLLEYPLEARELAIEGTVILKVVVDEQGHMEVDEVIESLGLACDTAAIAAVEQLPRLFIKLCLLS